MSDKNLDLSNELEELNPDFEFELLDDLEQFLEKYAKVADSKLLEKIWKFGNTQWNNGRDYEKTDQWL